MRLTRWQTSIGLDKPFVSNTGVVTAVRQCVLELTWQGLTGYGTARDADPAEIDACAPLLTGASPHEMCRVLGDLDAAGIGPASRSAVDMALHDLLGKACGQPLQHVLGLAGLPTAPTALSIGACPDDELRAKARDAASWPVLKLKLTPEDDGSRAGVLRSVYGGRIRADGNGSWTPDQALRVAEELHRHGVELLEQPVPPDSPDDLRYVHERSPVPVFADEDCASAQDVLRLQGRVSGVNIKLLTCGGLLAAREAIALARRVGLQVMLGCKVESSLGVTAMAQLAGLADHLDLDGHLGLTDDPFTGVRIDRGVISRPETPGLGAQPDPVHYPTHRGNIGEH
ncbi:mandelate racemase/muconate lactonizing enzyme family protein [Streptomyces sp. NBC_00057]|uniref:mandelate racemase/muconate lactonizing enzyme family protein n=1 Tax=Streptomyces sp. NBC_00057 TaxID=2975634 RepID=UPI00325135D2